tara:strand:- start:676 stop:927 length:252 start_codon:yes stop_codon:yes gene_type:complete
MIVSPCISICKTDPVSGYCYGCARNREEIRKWGNPSTDDEWKLENIKNIRNRLKGLQLKNFETSYNYKIQNSNSSLTKKRIKG